MQLKEFTDEQLIRDVKLYVDKEREALIAVLHHLKEIDRRKLYCDFGCNSLFDFAVRELKYSEDQAARRIQAMRLIRDVPQAEQKIASGELSLSNAHKVQTTLRKMQQAEPMKNIRFEDKLELVNLVSGKSAREAEKELFKIAPEAVIPQERERMVSETQSEVRFIMNDSLRAKLENIRTLLGTEASGMSYADLFEKMADVSEPALRAKKFGAKSALHTKENTEKETVLGTPRESDSDNPRYIPQTMKHFVWERDSACCTNCKSTRNLQYDHVIPVALGGKSTPDNLRLLCFACNQRASIQIFGQWCG